MRSAAACGCAMSAPRCSAAHAADDVCHLQTIGAHHGRRGRSRSGSRPTVSASTCWPAAASERTGSATSSRDPRVRIRIGGRTLDGDERASSRASRVSRSRASLLAAKYQGWSRGPAAGPLGRRLAARGDRAGLIGAPQGAGDQRLGHRAGRLAALVGRLESAIGLDRMRPIRDAASSARPRATATASELTGPNVRPSVLAAGLSPRRSAPDRVDARRRA